MKFQLVNSVIQFLERKGFDTCEYVGGCFDVAARRDKLLLLKILLNIDSFQRGQARDLKLLSSLLSARPFLVGKRSRRENLEDDAIYERFG
ncbi:MAG: transcriptional regulator, partial [Candidatus Aenigmatarchaeota archaeon]